jgi:predicted HTH domain antitoxin
MGALDLQDVSKSTSETAVSLGTIAELTGFPIDYIKRELLLDGEVEEAMTVEELRKKVLAYLDSSF